MSRPAPSAGMMLGRHDRSSGYAALDMTDHAHAELTRILDRGDGFGHGEHLELAWTLLGRLPAPAASAAIHELLRHLAATHGMPERFHATLTEAWIHVVARHRQLDPGRSFEEFLELHPMLLDQRLMSHHYGADLLAEDASRRTWVEPDIRPLPSLV